MILYGLVSIKVILHGQLVKGLLFALVLLLLNDVPPYSIVVSVPQKI